MEGEAALFMAAREEAFVGDQRTRLLRIDPVQGRRRAVT
jgi:hypothetical protein